jgi:hypothetical protein
MGSELKIVTHVGNCTYDTAHSPERARDKASKSACIDPSAAASPPCECMPTCARLRTAYSPSSSSFRTRLSARTHPPTRGPIPRPTGGGCLCGGAAMRTAGTGSRRRGLINRFIGSLLLFHREYSQGAPTSPNVFNAAFNLVHGVLAWACAHSMP